MFHTIFIFCTDRAFYDILCFSETFSPLLCSTKDYIILGYKILLSEVIHGLGYFDVFG